MPMRRTANRLGSELQGGVQLLLAGIEAAVARGEADIAVAVLEGR